MKVNLNYREFNLGTLTMENNFFVYNSNVKQEQLAQATYPFALMYYGLKNSKNLRSSQLFQEFNVFAESANREDIVKKAKIKDDDSVIVKLGKIAKLLHDKSEWHIS